MTALRALTGSGREPLPDVDLRELIGTDTILHLSLIHI